MTCAAPTDIKVRCPDHDVELVRAETRYGPRWGCPAQDCTVVWWSSTRTSTPANQETRRLRHLCHQKFDRFWYVGDTSPFKGKPGGRKNRRIRAYAWLAEQMGLAIDVTHFGMFNADQCRTALKLMRGLNQRGGAA